MADHPVAGAANGDPTELLDVDVNELAWVTTLVAVGWLERVEPRSLAEPDRFSHSETVESGRSSTSAISAAVIRSLRIRSIASTRACASRLGERRGHEKRSNSSWSPAR
jgi:hypothetical protein